MNPKKFAHRFKKAFRDPDRKPIIKMLWEYSRFKIKNPIVAEQYFYKYLYRKKEKNPGNFILTHKLISRIWFFNDMHYFSILGNKLNAELFFTKHKIPIVTSIAYNHNTLFFYKEQFIQVHEIDEFANFLFSLKNESFWENDELFIKKKQDSWGGKNIFKINYNDLLNNKTGLDSIFKTILSSDYLYQNKIIQHPILSEVNPYCVNTLRIDTFTNQQGITKIFSIRLRTSGGTNFVDNPSYGGLFVGIDPETGSVHEEAFTDFEKGPGKVYSSHPQTGFTFKNLEIPHFEACKQLAIKAAKLLPKAKVTAWDIAIQPDGPILIEGNFFPGLHNCEIALRGFGNNPVFSEMLKELSDQPHEINPNFFPALTVR